MKRCEVCKYEEFQLLEIATERTINEITKTPAISKVEKLKCLKCGDISWHWTYENEFNVWVKLADK